ncbi:MAG: DUF4349 domain-containing protein [Oscillospiraceae bacterium]|nr:DUF4349 domain-containing protein [Oscillospiraceae bacterium]
MSKYNEIMDRLNVDRDMKNRIVDNIGNAQEPKVKTIKYPGLKKYLSVAASIAVAAIVLTRVPKFLSGGGMKSADSAETLTSIDFDYMSFGKMDTAAETENGYSVTDGGTVSDKAGTPSDKLLVEPQEDKKIIYTADLHLNVKSEDYADTISRIKRQVSETGGYIENLSQNSYTYSSHTEITARVPAGAYRAFLDGMPNYGKVTYLSEKSEDITNVYKDYESRLNSKTSERDRLTQLLEKADTMRDIIQIEDKLADVQADIEYYESIIRTYDNKVSYCTVVITVDTDKSVTYTEPSFFEKLSAAFADGLNHVADMAEGIVLYIAEYGFVLAIIAAAVYTVYKFAKKRRGKQ